MGTTKTIVLIYILFTVLPVGIITSMDNTMLTITLKIVLGIIGLFAIASAFYSLPGITLGPHLIYLAVITFVFCFETTPNWLSYTVSFLGLFMIYAKFKQISDLEKNVENLPR